MGENLPTKLGIKSFATAFSDAIAARGVTLTWLRKCLAERGNPVSAATLSYWRSGARRPESVQSRASIAEIETLLGLSPGALSDLIGPTVRTGPMPTPVFPLKDADMEHAVTDAFGELGVEMPDPARDLTNHTVTEVGPDGHVLSRTTRTVIQAISGTIRSVPYIDMSPGVPSVSPIFSAVGGGTIVKRYSHPNGQIHGAEYELERPITAPDVGILEWRIDFPAEYPSGMETGHGVARPCRELLQWTKFHPDAIPDWIEETVEGPEGTISTPLTLDGGTSILQVRRKFGPGILILRWGYGEREPVED